MIDCNNTSNSDINCRTSDTTTNSNGSSSSNSRLIETNSSIDENTNPTTAETNETSRNNKENSNNNNSNNKKSYPIEDYEKRFLNSLKLLNENAPKWITKSNYNTNNTSGRKQQNTSSSTNSSTSSYSSGTTSTNWSQNHTKIKYDRIKLRARQQQQQQQNQQQQLNNHTNKIINHSSRSLNTSRYIGEVGEEYDEDLDRANGFGQKKSDIKNCKSLMILDQNKNNNNNNNQSQRGPRARSTVDENSSNMRRSLSNYSYYNSTSSLRPLSNSNSSLNSGATLNNWYKPKTLQLPSSSSQNSVKKEEISNTTNNSTTNNNTTTTTTITTITTSTTLVNDIKISNSSSSRIVSNDPKLNQMDIEQQKSGEQADLQAKSELNSASASSLGSSVSTTINTKEVKQEEATAKPPQIDEPEDENVNIIKVDFKPRSTASILNYEDSPLKLDEASKIKIEKIANNRARNLISRLDYRNDDEVMNYDDEIIDNSVDTKKIKSSSPSPLLNLPTRTGGQSGAEESYDNLNNSNSIDASYIIDDEDINQEDLNNINIIDNYNKQDLALPKPAANSSSIPPVLPRQNVKYSLDYENKSNTTSFVYSNTPPQQQSGGINTNSSSNENSFVNKSDLADQQLQVSEEIEEDYDDDACVDNDGLRNYDHDYNYQNDQSGYSNDDEFFLISTPSPFNLTSPSNTASAVVPNNKEDSQQQSSQQAPVIRYQYDLNRLSNIIEEEDSNYDDEESSHSRLNKSKRSSPSPLANSQQDTMSISSNSKKDFLDEASVNNYKEMLLLGEQVTNMYKNIENELSKPSFSVTRSAESQIDYKPVMKKRVYHLNSAYYKTDEQSSAEQSLPPPPQPPPPVHPPSSSQDLSATKLSRTIKYERKDERIEPSNEEEPDSILNYLIGRLSEQHKSKFTPEPPVPVTMPKVTYSTEPIGNDFDQFEKHLFEKYALPLMDQSHPPKQQSNLPLIQDSQMDSDDIIPIVPNNDASYILTRSLYAQHKQINLDTAPTELNLDDSSDYAGASKKLKITDSNIVPLRVNTDYRAKSSSVSPNTNKIITALSINEIETRKSFRTSTEIPSSGSHRSVILTDDDEEDEESESDEKKIKEEIVLIGEKSDIESLLDNQNNQLFNLILANTNRTNKIDEIESDLNKKRYNHLKEQQKQERENNGKVSLSKMLAPGEDIEIEIEIADKKSLVQADEAQSAPMSPDSAENYEQDLKDIAKYIVDEITKISINKIKIDQLNETLDKKYFTKDLLTKHEILTNLIAENQSSKNNAELTVYDDGKSPLLTPTTVAPVNVKSREELFDYYTNLEKNLQQVRSEIDKLKQEAFEDLAYINEILSSDHLPSTMNDEDSISADPTPAGPMESQEPSVAEDLIDYDQVYLTNVEENETKSKETSSTVQEEIDENVNIIDDKDDHPIVEEEEDDDEETQYLSQPVSVATTIASNVNLNNFNDSSQLYLTPAESWQTLTNQHIGQRRQGVPDDAQPENEDEHNNTINNEKLHRLSDGNQTDQDVESDDDTLIHPPQHNAQQTQQQASRINISNEIIYTKTTSHYQDSMQIDRVEELTENAIHSKQITQLVKNVLTRPNVPAPPVPNSIILDEVIVDEESYHQVTIDPSNRSRKTEAYSSSIALSKSPTAPQLNTNNTRSRSTGPNTNSIQIHQQGVILEKKSLDKFLKLASNSASLLDLNQHQHQQQQQQSKPDTNSYNINKTSSNNLLSLCGVDQLNSTSSKLKSASAKNATIITPTNNNNNINNYTNTINNKTTSNANKPQQQQQQELTKPIIIQRQTTNRNSTTNNNKNSSFDNKVELLIRNSTSNLNLLDLSSDPQQQQQQKNKNTFRVPSSRHFCGRLLSNNLSSTTNSGSDTRSSSSSLSNESFKAETNKKPTPPPQKSNQQQLAKKFISSSDDEVDEEISIESDSDDDRRNIKKQVDSVVLSTSSPSTASSSPKSSSPPYRNHYQQQTQPKRVEQPAPQVDTRRSVSSNQHIYSSSRNNYHQHEQSASPSVNSQRVRFLPQEQGRNSSTTTANPKLSASSDLLNTTPTSNRDYNIRPTQPRQQTPTSQYQPQQQQHQPQYQQPNQKISLAKSVDHLLADDLNSTNNSLSLSLSRQPPPKSDSKAHLVIKKIDHLQSQKDINNILMANSRQMPLSKSIKDLRLFVSNSYSPSQIVRPPPNPPVAPVSSSVSQSTGVSTSKSNGNLKQGVLDELNTNLITSQKKNIHSNQSTPSINKNYENIYNQPKAPVIMNQSHTRPVIKETNIQDPMQVRMEYMQQQNLINKLKKQQSKEQLPLKQQQFPEQDQKQRTQQPIYQPQQIQQRAPVSVNPRSVYLNQGQNTITNTTSRNERNDEALINCILDMKPLPHGQHYQPQPHAPRSSISNNKPVQQQPQQQQYNQRPSNEYYYVNPKQRLENNNLINSNNNNIIKPTTNGTAIKNIITSGSSNSIAQNNSNASQSLTYTTTAVSSSYDNRKRVKKETNL